jgi:xylan 1,4-beta-xylosidase
VNRTRRRPAGTGNCRRENVPIDFVSTHTYGNAPLDYRPVVEEHAAAGHPKPEIWWTEWGVTPTHFNPVSDAVFSAPFILRGMKAALDSTDALAYWVISDHFEELGWPPRLFHGGFGLLTVGNLRKPRFWALHLLNQLGPTRLPATVAGDGAGGMVDVLAARRHDGSIQILIWNGTLDQNRVAGSAELARTVALTVDGLPSGDHRAVLTRVDADHGDIRRTWQELGAPDWPDADGWAALRAADHLETQVLGVFDGNLRLELPMPGIALIEIAES